MALTVTCDASVDEPGPQLAQALALGALPASAWLATLALCLVCVWGASLGADALRRSQS